MSYLLDTHALFWWVYFPELLPAKVRETLGDADIQVFASAVSAYEMSYKHYRGRWPEAELLVGAFEELVASEGFDLLPMSARHAIRAGSYDRQHRDPFDRMLVAQAAIEDLRIVSSDKGLRLLGAEPVWA
ncbi:type II toxin-antitoxin system VapC family toxin [Mesorhizobium xinjiangense]|uniref:type II toxin-antitoxin system VapC family toxin n=1 Tax=Mesorhizobium xinjiangense TaxID=2678685 RepID=UPI0012EDF4B4|nr:type II toxin-antitoxin system VapC family toxin [Mesorhizobium xinjiangense]